MDIVSSPLGCFPGKPDKDQTPVHGSSILISLYGGLANHFQAYYRDELEVYITSIEVGIVLDRRNKLHISSYFFQCQLLSRYILHFTKTRISHYPKEKYNRPRGLRVE